LDWLNRLRLILRGNSYRWGLLEFGSIYAGLPDDRLQGSNPNFIVVGHRNGNGARRQSFLHHDMASPAAHFFEPMHRQNCTHLFTG
jgi:hypothetical protein